MKRTPLRERTTLHRDCGPPSGPKIVIAPRLYPIKYKLTIWSGTFTVYSATHDARILSIFKRKSIHFLQHIPDRDDDFPWLALMQDHGAPTRLLDFTWSPYVAAFFALHNTTHEGVIWACNPAEIEKRKQVDLEK